MSDKYFFDHLKDDNSDEHHGESEKYDNYNEYSEERDDCSVDLVCNVFAESSKISPEQCIMTILLKKQLAKKNSSNVPMSLRKSPPESIIDQLTAQKNLLEQPNTQLTATLEAVQVDNNAIDPELFCHQLTSEESETSSQLDAKYEAQKRSLGWALCNWQCGKCYLPNCPAICCQFKDSCNNFVHKRCSILWSRTYGQNVQINESVGCFCQEHYMDYDKNVLPNQTNNGAE